jgi:hypothetical protein
MRFGVLAVNQYFGYYQTWGAAAADLTNQGVSSTATVSVNSLAGRGPADTDVDDAGTRRECCDAVPGTCHRTWR